MKVYIDGSFYAKEDANISVFDHGFLYGDGAFEGIRSYNSLIFKLEEHIDRLYETAHTLMINVSLSKDEMAQAIVETLVANQLRDAYIRVIVTRGVGDLGLDPRKCIGNARLIIITDKITLYPEDLYKKGMDIITVPTTRNLTNAIDPQLKSLNYLNNILAKMEANNSGYSEAIMLDPQGFVAECTGDNVFVIKNDVLTTPSQGRLKGITRQAVLDIATAMGLEWEERLLTRHEVFIADECFLTGTAAEIIPVVKVDGRVVGEGKPGQRTQEIRDRFMKMTASDGLRYELKDQVV